MRTTEFANLDCAFVENALVFVVLEMRGEAGPPWPPLYDPSSQNL